MLKPRISFSFVSVAVAAVGCNELLLFASCAGCVGSAGCVGCVGCAGLVVFWSVLWLQDSAPA
jgi:hypothetical protein